ncbi:TonB-dependent receptor [Terrimonas pollutisoli]|uniref:TonB-dependent receptor n=1 Tax=Terrimonas pollutisoli TaxID=3034147 RepID=UPI0023ED626F|nr:TonB-dependent receptor [Terrimonas sp. H1YJ31]
MNLTAVFMLSLTLNVAANGFGQDRISLRMKKTEIGGILRTIEKQTNYRFLYNDNLEEIREKVTINVREASLGEVLNLLLDNTRLQYQLMNDNLVVIKEDSNAPTRLPDVVIRGKVTGEGGAPLSGASVIIKGTNTGTSTNNEGNFSITAADANVTLVISSVGYDAQEVALGGRTDITVALVTSTKVMDQVVVIGYGTASKRDLTGSITKVSGKDIADKPNTNPVASLQGKVAGLSVVNNGTPGAEPDIRIRGTISIGSVKPLYVVDGIFNDNIDYINPNDIESVEILKDPSSLAIFGVKGAAGVIAITTKRAKAGQTIINVNSSFGFKKLVDKIKLANAADFQTLFEEEKANIGVTAPFDYAKWPFDTDWIDVVTRTGKFNTNNLSLSNSSEKNKFNLGFGYIKDQGLIKHEELKRYTFSFSDEVKINKSIKLGFNFNGIRQRAPYGYAGNVLSDARKVVPITSAGTKSYTTRNAYGADSVTYDMYYLLPSIQGSGVVNPLVTLENEWDKTIDREYRMVASVFAEINFLKDFTLRTTFYGDQSNRNVRQYTPLYYGYDNNNNSALLVNTLTSVREKDYTYRKWQQDYILSYKKNFGEHGLNLTAGWTTYYFGNFNRFGYVEQSPTGLPIPNNKRFWYIDNGFGLVTRQSSTPPSGETRQREYSTASALFRALYNYAGKYYLNASLRRDGSSQISPSNRWQSFWAVGAAWELTKEEFMADQTTFDFLKIKGSIGVLGNQNTYGYDYPFYPGLTSSKVAVFANDNIFPASEQAYLPAQDLKWETVHAKEIGVELDALKRKLHFEANYFNKLTKDLMTFIPGLHGAQNGLDNIGQIRNSGFEFSAIYTQPITSDFTLTVSGNLTTYKNKVVELATKDFAIIQSNSRTIIGYPIGSFYGLTVDGIWQSNSEILQSPLTYNLVGGSPQPGDFKYRDISGPKGIPDSVINSFDYGVIGNPTPDFAYGGTVSLNYKGMLDLSVDVGGVYGNEIFRNYGNTEATFQRVNYFGFKTERWHGAGTSNWEPILAQDHRNNYQASTYNIEDGSYFRIRNIQLGFNFPSTMIKRAGIKGARIFANVQNLKTYKRNYGYAPEFGGSALEFGVDNSGGAIPLVTTFGVNLTF